jgi:hypothetical protein
MYMPCRQEAKVGLLIWSALRNVKESEQQAISFSPLPGLPIAFRAHVADGMTQ